ncbi:hypothetical protein WA026_010758 [Henosepilachna vigintioctopunctata]|uniref:Uncharacterized protein n=1 Tax=Henosepilachna vigintioctopunctata TaxID=420089 RepID=A0AAW1UZ61_9CUCU
MSGNHFPIKTSAEQHDMAWWPCSGVNSPSHLQRVNSDKVRGTSNDLFELIEKIQCSRLDDQRCLLPASFNQVYIVHF